MKSGYLTRQTCAACGSALRRAHRQDGEVSQRGMRRYACVSANCDWQGLLPRMPARRRAPAVRRWRMALRRVAAPLALATALLASVTLAATLVLREVPKPLAFAPGDHHDGTPLPPSHPLLKLVAAKDTLHQQTLALASSSQASSQTSPQTSAPQLNLRQGCVWGRPGGNPYRGTVEQALNMASLPAEVVSEIARQVRAKAPVDHLDISNDGIVARDSARRFDPHNVAMTYGTTLCLATRVNFVRGHSEPAALYEAADHAGRIYSVMVPSVCGNVSVLGQPQNQTAESPVGDPGSRRLPVQLGGGPGVTTAVTDPHSHTVPLPGTLVLVLAGLALLWRSRQGR